MKPLFRLLLLLVALGTGTRALAANMGVWLDTVGNELGETWKLGTNEYYATFHTAHMPWAYTDAQNKQYQNRPPGFGIGRGHYDVRGDWHGVYAIGFQDSHFKPEWAIGYGWQTYWQTGSGLKLGLGYTAGLTTREDILHYTPIPYVLPMISVVMDKLSIEGIYVPGGGGHGNVMLFMAKWHTDNTSLLGW